MRPLAEAAELERLQAENARLHATVRLYQIALEDIARKGAGMGLAFRAADFAYCRSVARKALEVAATDGGAAQEEAAARGDAW